MSPLPPLLRPRDPPAPTDGNNQENFTISPSLIVGICILASIFFCVMLASVIRLCQRSDTPPENEANLFRPHDPSQIKRMHEVRRINNKFAWERGRWARVELLKQGRRMTPGYDDGLVGLAWESGSTLGHDGSGSGDEQHGAHPTTTHLHPNTCRYSHTHRESRPLQVGDINPYPHPSRTSPHRRQTRTYHEHKKSDDGDKEEEIELEAFPQFPGLPGYVTAAQERGRRGRSGVSGKEKGKERRSVDQWERFKADSKVLLSKNSQVYLGQVIKKISSGLEQEQRQAQAEEEASTKGEPVAVHRRQQQHRQQQTRTLTPTAPLPIPSAKLLQAQRHDGDFEDVCLNTGTNAASPAESTSKDPHNCASATATATAVWPVDSQRNLPSPANTAAHGPRAGEDEDLVVTP